MVDGQQRGSDVTVATANWETITGTEIYDAVAAGNMLYQARPKLEDDPNQRPHQFAAGDLLVGQK